MEYRDAVKLLAMLRAYNYKFDGEAQAVANAWQQALYDCPYKLAEAAVIQFARNDRGGYSKYPKPGDILEQIEMMTGATTAVDLWNVLRKKIGGNPSRAREDFESLPDEIRRYVGSPQAFRELGNMPTETLDSVYKGQFLREIPMLQKSRETQERLPAEMRQALNGAVQIGE